MKTHAEELLEEKEFIQARIRKLGSEILELGTRLEDLEWEIEEEQLSQEQGAEEGV